MSRSGRLLPLLEEYARLQTQFESLLLESTEGAKLLDDLEAQLHLIADTRATNIAVLKAKLDIYAESLGFIDDSTIEGRFIQSLIADAQALNTGDKALQKE